MQQARAFHRKRVLSLDPPRPTHEMMRLRWSRPFLAARACTHYVKRDPVPNYLLTSGDTIKFADASVDQG
jgi:hypothetical protein